MNTSMLIAAVREVAIEEPETVYSNDAYGMDCIYREETGEPSCLIGHAMNRIGQLDLIQPGTALIDGKCRNTMDVTMLLRDMEVDATKTQQQWLDTVQKKQDHGHAWGVAVQLTDYEMGPIG